MEFLTGKIGKIVYVTASLLWIGLFYIFFTELGVLSSITGLILFLILVAFFAAVVFPFIKDVRGSIVDLIKHPFGL